MHNKNMLIEPVLLLFIIVGTFFGNNFIREGVVLSRIVVICYFVFRGSLGFAFKFVRKISAVVIRIASHINRNTVPIFARKFVEFIARRL